MAAPPDTAQKWISAPSYLQQHDYGTKVPQGKL
jgi:hypothetical protein